MALGRLAPVFDRAGFRPYTRLQRMARIDSPSAANLDGDVNVAQKTDAAAVLNLIESAFDCLGEQLPRLYEIETAIEARQVLVARQGQELGGVLYFETQGMASTVRFWAVAERFRDRRLGSALMQHYFQIHAAVRRFSLWVNTANDNAIAKYRHYGYAPDGLLDQVFAKTTPA